MFGIFNTLKSVSGYVKSSISSIFGSSVKEGFSHPSNRKNTVPDLSKNNQGFSDPTNKHRSSLSTDGIEFSSLKENKIPEKVISNLQSVNFSLQNSGLVSSLDHDELLQEINEYYSNIDNQKKSSTKITEHCKLITNKILNKQFHDLRETDHSLESNIRETYEKFFKNYFNSAINLITELQKILTLELIKQKNLNPGLFVKQIEMCKEISINIASNYLNKINDIVNHIPDIKVDETNTLKKSIIENHKNDIRKLIIAANFGAISEELLNSVYDNQLLDHSLENKEKELYNSLSFLWNFQKNTQGALIISSKDEEIKVASFKEDIAVQALIFYIHAIIKNFEINYDAIPNSKQQENIGQLEFSKNNLRQFLFNVIRVELNTNAKANDLTNISHLNSIGIDVPEEQNFVKKQLAASVNIFNILGKNDDKIPGFNIENTSLFSFLNRGDAQRHFERIILEVSLLAGIDAICTFKGWKKSDEPLINKYKNANTIPWIKNFYAGRYEKMQAMIKNEKSEIHIAKAIEYVSNLALELTKSTQLFDVENFIERYDIKKPFEEIINYMLTQTRLGVMSLNILFFKSFLSDILSKDENKASLTDPSQLRELKRLIDILETESRLKNERNETIYAPIVDTKAVDDALERLSKKFSDTGSLINNAEVITSFFTSSVNSLSKAQKTDDQEKEDFLHSKNIVLASWLFYILVKFLPERSHDVHSLRIRKNIFALMFNDRWSSQKIIPSTLYKKLKNQALGTEDDSGHQNGKLGVFKSLLNELDSRIEEVARKEKSEIPLKDLLYIYADVEDILNSNPRTFNALSQPNTPLLRGLINSIPLIVDSDLKLSVDFAKTYRNPDFKTSLAKVLLEKASTLIKKIPINGFGEIEIKDSDEVTIRTVIQTLEYLEYLGHLKNEYNYSKLNLDINDFLNREEKLTGRNEAQRIISPRIALTDKFLNLRANLIDDPKFSNNQEAFPGQFQLKARLLQQIKKFTTVRPAVGTILDWLDPKRITNLRANSLQQSKVVAV